MKAKHKRRPKVTLSDNPVLWWNELNPVYKFLPLFFIVMYLFYELYMSVWFRGWPHKALLDVYANISATLLGWLGHEMEVGAGGTLNGEASLVIKRGCDALEPLAIFFTAILAYPAAVSKKIVGLLSGAVLLFLLNIVRIIILYIAILYSNELFQFLHATLLQMVMILLTVLMFMFWINYSIPSNENTK